MVTDSNRVDSGGLGKKNRLQPIHQMYGFECDDTYTALFVRETSLVLFRSNTDRIDPHL